MNTDTIAIDIGNTNTAIGCINIENKICTKKLIIANGKKSDTIINSLIAFYKESALTLQIPIIICSVNNELTSSIQEGLHGAFPSISISKFCYSPTFPITVEYEDPLKLGTDRLANGIYGLQSYPGENIIIVDAGTAIKIDCFTKNHCFRGGYIFPGISAQFHALHTSTDALPHCKIQQKKCSTLPQSTSCCISEGVLSSLAGGIETIISSLQAFVNGEVMCLACGGGWPLIQNRIKLDLQYIEDLTLIGIGMFNYS